VISDSIDAVLFQRNGAYINILALVSGLDGSAVNNATVTGSIQDANGNVVLALEFASTDSEGDYQAAVPSTFNPNRGFYTAVIDITAPGLAPAHFELPVTVDRRQTLD